MSARVVRPLVAALLAALAGFGTGAVLDARAGLDPAPPGGSVLSVDEAPVPS